MDFDMLRRRWCISATGEALDSDDPLVIKKRKAIFAEAMEFWNSMNREVNRTCIWADLPDPGNPYTRDRVCLASYRRLESMARALYAKEELPKRFTQDILEALRFLYRNWYNEHDRKGGEWWHKEIGIPLSLNRCILFLYDELGDAVRSDYIRAVESYANPPDLMCIEDIPEESTGANRAWKCLVLAQCGILKKDAHLLQFASDKIRDVFCYAEQGDGFYKDGSFIQHRKFAYTGGYGISFLDSIVTYIDITKDTPWCIQNEEMEILMDWVENAYVPLVFRGGFMSMARGREIARREAQEHEIGHQLITALLKLSNAVPNQVSLKIRKQLKYWITADSYRDYLQYSPIETLNDAKLLLENPKIVPMEDKDTCRIYAAMDKVVHRRESFAVAISMSSERTGRYESIHNENVRGWYTSDGMLYLYNSDLAQFSDDYFPTVDAYRMPGTTVDTITRRETGVGFGQELPIHTSWAGGSCLDNRYGAVGMELEAECSDLKAKKSWFLFDEEIVCLGAGITASQGHKIETIVENRKIHKKTAEILTYDNTHLQWLHLRGPVPGNDIGYFLPGQQNLEISEEIRTGSWQEINHTNRTEVPCMNRFLSVVLNHGVNPKNDGYLYFILPGKNVDEVKTYAASPSIKIISNTKQMQAVYHEVLNITCVNFWEDTLCSIAGLTCDKKASVMMRETTDRIELCVSDPTWKNQDGIHVELDRQASAILNCNSGIQVVQLKPVVKLTVQTANASGKSFSIILIK